MNEEKKELTVEEQKKILDEKKAKEQEMLAGSPGTIDKKKIDVNAPTIAAIESVANVTSETKVDADVNTLVLEKDQEQNNTIEEVSVAVTENSLDLNPEEISESSVFNKKQEAAETQKKLSAEPERKKKFPFLMILIFIVFIIGAFNIDKVSSYIMEYLGIKNPLSEEEETPTKEKVTKEKEIVVKLSDVADKLKSSTNIVNFETSKNISIEISSINDEKLTLTTSDYINNDKEVNLYIEYTKEENTITATCPSLWSEYCNEMNLYVLVEIQKLRGDTNEKLLENFRTTITSATIDKNGYSILGDTKKGTVTYSIVLNKNLVYTNTKTETK